MRIIAIDPGYERMGIAVLERIHGKDVLLYSSCVVTPRDVDFSLRLGMLTEEFRAVIREWKPEQCAIEKLFFTNNQKTAMRVSETRGALIGAATECRLPIFDYSPLEIKVAVTGFGHAGKGEVSGMVRRLVKMSHIPKHDDEYDAIACGLTHLATVRPSYPHA